MPLSIYPRFSKLNILLLFVDIHVFIRHWRAIQEISIGGQGWAGGRKKIQTRKIINLEQNLKGS